MPPCSSTRDRPLVLVVDDDLVARELMRATLEHEGYAVAEAEDGRRGLESFEKLEPDLVIVDVHMPELDGLATCRHLRQRFPQDSTPILFMTGADDRESVDRAYDAGATDFIGKPLNLALLAHRVRFLLRANRSMALLQRSQASLARAQRIAQLGSWECYEDLGDMVWSEETYRILGVGAGSLRPSLQTFLRHVHPDDREAVRESIWEALHVSKAFNVQNRVLRPDGSVRYVHQQGELVLDGRAVTRLSATIQDVTEQRLAQDKIQHLANFDSLTGLANRRLFKDRLQRAVRSAAERNERLGVLYMDLDQFKRINDSLGHSGGDLVLQHVARLLLDMVRGSDLVGRVEDAESPRAEVSRLGGDEFTVLLSGIAEQTDAGDVARRVLAALPEPISVDGHEVSTTGSIGISVYPEDGEDAETLLKHADTAMYHAKERGRNTLQFFCESMNQATGRKLTLETRLRVALENGELQVHYQPRIDLRTGAMVATEALLRWEDPELGKISPKEIIPLAEDTGLIGSLGAWVLDTACTQNRAWQDAGYEPVRVSVNVSSRQFTHHDLRETVRRALDRSQMEPHHLELEITESVVLQDDEATALVLRDLKAMGVGVALDDFGTGYSSLSYLPRFPLDVLKMDRCFVRDVERDPSAAGIAAAVISMAHSLGATVVAEGVDSPGQRSFLQEQGCDEVQGFLVSGALPARELTRFLTRRRDD
jgi:diguanylate cyclase (GGDEF)-like protein/PAS domain S-box-containing protein